MQKYQIIFHIDLNAFFASCEIALNPALAHEPIGIGGASGRGVLTTANYEARKYGVTSAMSVGEARRLCPNLKLLPVNFPLYEEKSDQFFDYLRQYTDVIEPASIDEGYVDMTRYCEGKDALEVARTMQQELNSQFQLPCSIGIAPNMFLAKMASDMKKPMGITILRKRDVAKILWPLPIESMHGIGKKTVPNLKLLGIHTIGDLAHYPDQHKLSKFLGNSTASFVGKAHGHDDRVIDPTRQEKHQSIGNSKTYDGYLHEYTECIEALESLTERVVSRLMDAEVKTKTITVQVRDHEFNTRSKAFSFPYHTQDLDAIMLEVERLFDELYDEQTVHLLGVSASHLEKTERLFKQLDIFKEKLPTQKDQAVEEILNQINKHYPKTLLKKGIK